LWRRSRRTQVAHGELRIIIKRTLEEYIREEPNSSSSSSSSSRSTAEAAATAAAATTIVAAAAAVAAVGATGGRSSSHTSSFSAPCVGCGVGSGVGEVVGACENVVKLMGNNVNFAGPIVLKCGALLGALDERLGASKGVDVGTVGA
jgi:hypothetical protein